MLDLGRLCATALSALIAPAKCIFHLLCEFFWNLMPLKEEEIWQCYPRVLAVTVKIPLWKAALMWRFVSKSSKWVRNCPVMYKGSFGTRVKSHIKIIGHVFGQATNGYIFGVKSGSPTIKALRIAENGLWQFETTEHLKGFVQLVINETCLRRSSPCLLFHPWTHVWTRLAGILRELQSTSLDI